MSQKIAFQGVEGAYSELALRRYFPDKETIPVPLPDFPAVFQAVASRRVAFAVLPVENSLAGSIHQNYDLMLNHPVVIVGEIKLPVEHHLLAAPGVKIGAVREVYSHPQALAQCAGYLRQHLPRAAAVAYFDTAGAARFVAESGRRDIAAIASVAAGQRYQLHSLKTGIQDHPENYTRFVVVRRHGRANPSRSPKATKTSIVFSLKHTHGALYKALSAFALRDIDLLKIESRPIPGTPWHYMFYLDFVQPAAADVSERALAHLQETTDFYRHLGTYQPG